MADDLAAENARLRARLAALEGPSIASSIVELVGNTPLLRLDAASAECGEVLGKLEFLNPGGSVKDRAALEIVLAAERDGLRRRRAPLEVADGTEACSRRERACAAIDGAFFCGQFANPANERSHYAATGTGGTAAAPAAPRGSGGAGAAPPPEIIVVEPELSRVLSGGQHHNGHGVTGIGAGVPSRSSPPRARPRQASSRRTREAAALGDALDAARDLGLTAGVLAGRARARRSARGVSGGSARRAASSSCCRRRARLTHPLFDAARREAELFGAQFAALSAFLASLFEGLPVAGGEDAGMTGAFRVTLATPNGSVLLSPYGFIDTPAARAPRGLKRDHGAIFTFLEEAENERMHLLVCMKMFEARPRRWRSSPPPQFTMTPLLCATYAASPRAMHRFVGYLEETAVMTYANLVEKAATPARCCTVPGPASTPDIAKSYWKLDDDASWAECLRHMLADESHHRDVNHAFAELRARRTRSSGTARDFDKAATATPPRSAATGRRRRSRTSGAPPQLTQRASSGNMRRLSFYQKKTITDDNMDALLGEDNPLSKLGWYDFLVHTELCTMNYDGLGVDDDMKLNHMIRMMENLRVPQTLKKPAGEILPFVYDIKMVMRDNSYHNFTHVTDVTQYMYTLLLATHVAERLRPVELAAAYIAAVCHDLDHPGLSNTYQNNENTELSKRYNKESPLENHHLSVFGRLCEARAVGEPADGGGESASSTSCTT
ncbi:hypothetical protein JL722_12739 [Aureococcus anophagefferens]|nr:hypothetical protein JL722_12739 [Aureococcus anophagefferens]